MAGRLEYRLLYDTPPAECPSDVSRHITAQHSVFVAMEDSDTLGIGERDDINLPLDEIIQRKAQRQRRPFRRDPRRGSPWRRYPRPTQEAQDYVGGYGNDGFPMEIPQGATWQPYNEQSMPAQHPMQEGPYYPMYTPPPPQIEPQPMREYRTQPPVEQVLFSSSDGSFQRGPMRGGIRKPVLDRRRGYGRQHPPGRPMEPQVPPIVQPPPPQEVTLLHNWLVE